VKQAVGWAAQANLQAECKHLPAARCRVVPACDVATVSRSLNHAPVRNQAAWASRSSQLCKPEVTGSIPVRSTEKGPGDGALSLVRAFAPGRARSGLERRMERAEICVPSALSAEEGGVRVRDKYPHARRRLPPCDP
jgi:hypothetical protein